MMENSKSIIVDLTREQVIEKRRLICDELFLLQTGYRKKSEEEQKLLDIKIRNCGKQLEDLVLPRRTTGSLYKQLRGLRKWVKKLNM